MIQAAFRLGGDVITVEVNGNSLMFWDTGMMKLSPIDGLKIDKGGVLKEFPDLVDNPEWRKIGIERFKTKFKSMKSESEKITYVINELVRYGYEPMFKKRKGWRTQKI